MTIHGEADVNKTLQGFPSEAVSDTAVWRPHKDACCSLAGWFSFPFCCIVEKHTNHIITEHPPSPSLCRSHLIVKPCHY